MKVLLLGQGSEVLIPALTQSGDTYEISLGTPDMWPGDVEFIVSFGYRHIIPIPWIKRFGEDRMINLHISILPWNKGADPNFWSWFDETPKGVSAHLITDDIDAGPVIGRVEFPTMRSTETLSSSYRLLKELATSLFHLEWERWRVGDLFTLPVLGFGSYHRTTDKTKWMQKLPLGWNTPCHEVEKMGREHREKSQQN